MGRSDTEPYVKQGLLECLTDGITNRLLWEQTSNKHIKLDVVSSQHLSCFDCLPYGLLIIQTCNINNTV